MNWLFVETQIVWCIMWSSAKRSVEEILMFLLSSIFKECIIIFWIRVVIVDQLQREAKAIESVATWNEYFARVGLRPVPTYVHYAHRAQNELFMNECYIYMIL